MTKPDQKSGEGTLAPVSFAEVLKAELKLIARKRKSTESAGADSKKDAAEQALDADLIGVSLSGGGIRSATFNLGVLQALAHLKILPKIDYLSTVSGGGYIGSFLSSWIKRCSLKEVIDELNPSHRKSTPSNEAPELQFLREYSNYLTPRKGILGLDTWTMILTYLRNFFLNLTILILALLCVLMIPKFGIDLNSYVQGFLFWPSILIAFFLFVFAVSVTSQNITSLTRIRSGSSITKSFSSQASFYILIPIFLGTVMLNQWLWVQRESLSSREYQWAVVGIFFYSFHWIMGSFFGNLFAQREAKSGPTLNAVPITPNVGKIKQAIGNFSETTSSGIRIVFKSRRRSDAWVILITSVVAGALGGVLTMYALNILKSIPANQPPNATYGPLIFGVPLLISVFMITEAFHIGLAGRGFSEEAREWWSRLGASMILINFAFSALAATSIYGAQIFDWLMKSGHDYAPNWLNTAVASGWLVTSILGVVAGKSSKTGDATGNKNLELIGKIAPFVFIIGILFLLQWTLTKMLNATWGEEITPQKLICELLAIAGLFVVAFTLSWRVGINEFSMSAFYRNRLSRCYLGATNPIRNAHPFTGFDPEDDNIRLKSLLAQDYQGPFPIINTALNLVEGRKLAWQNRKASSFFFSPLYSGFDPEQDQVPSSEFKAIYENGYRPTRWYGNQLSLGAGVAISGAAASPNMGYHTSAALSILMTIFNVRLGTWVANPRRVSKGIRRRLGPATGLFYLFFELLGKTHDRRGYVYLSDGGHFENLGIYELAKRRCRLIIAVDAGEDRGLKFGDLGNAIEKCRVDLGVDIDLTVTPIKITGEKEHSTWHCVVGSIRYPECALEDSGGTIIYLKSSLTGDEPSDVLRYKAQNEDFPHQSTADQFFDEAQFESYRMLGYHIASDSLKSSSSIQGDVNARNLAVQMNDAWIAKKGT